MRQMGSQLLTPILWAIPWRFMDEMRRMTMEGYGWPIRIHAQAHSVGKPIQSDAKIELS